MGIGAGAGGAEKGELKNVGTLTGVPEDCMGVVVRRRRSASEVLAGEGEADTGGLALARICARLSELLGG